VPVFTASRVVGVCTGYRDIGVVVVAVVAAAGVAFVVRHVAAPWGRSAAAAAGKQHPFYFPSTAATSPGKSILSVLFLVVVESVTA